MVLNYDGKQVSIGDQVDIMGVATTVTGVGALAAVLVTGLYENSFTTQANAMYAKQNDSVPLSASSWVGKNFTADAKVYVPGTVSAISGDGVTALLTIILAQTGASVIVCAGSVRSHG